ncbi:ATP-binding protein [Nocardioides sp. GCM10027113]|uniref:ATP-binding protein n=1 Tax=unclassified Nocardioides TaxID=2615069 RepID=UPI003618AFE1
MTDAHITLGELEHVPDRLAVLAPAVPDVLELVHSLLEQLWHSHPEVGDTDRMRFETAVVEILGNIVEHAYELDAGRSPAPDEWRRFQLVVGVTPHKVVATFGDNGLPAALDLGAALMPGVDAESGRGLALAKATLDVLDYSRVDGRNRWLLECHRQDG